MHSRGRLPSPVRAARITIRRPGAVRARLLRHPIRKVPAGPVRLGAPAEHTAFPAARTRAKVLGGGREEAAADYFTARSESGRSKSGDSNPTSRGEEEAAGVRTRKGQDVAGQTGPPDAAGAPGACAKRSRLGRSPLVVKRGGGSHSRASLEPGTSVTRGVPAPSAAAGPARTGAPSHAGPAVLPPPEILAILV